VEEGIRKSGISGRYELEEALRLLLNETGLTYRFTDANTVTLEQAPAQPTIDVSTPLNESKTVLFRVNGAYENSESFRDFVSAQRYFAALVLTWKISSATTLTIERNTSVTRERWTTGSSRSGIAPPPFQLSAFSANHMHAPESKRDGRIRSRLEGKQNYNPQANLGVAFVDQHFQSRVWRLSGTVGASKFSQY
jgi:hypothetical protein